MAKRMRYCFWCGEELGIYDNYYDDLDICGKPECEREARRIYQDEISERSCRAQRDEFSRYR
jgi:hypothetical protein